MRRVAAMVALGVGFGAATVAGQSTQASMRVAAQVSRTCQIDAGPLAFGAYDPIGLHSTAPLDGEAIITVTCTKGTPAVIALGAGGNASGSQRFMANGTFRLQYDLYQDSTRSLPWGDTSGNWQKLRAATGDSMSISVYGRIPGAQDVSVGTYSDSVVATVYF
jgi:spore coat protein U-like protein